jgi:hypothetical protein
MHEVIPVAFSLPNHADGTPFPASTAGNAALLLAALVAPPHISLRP